VGKEAGSDYTRSVARGATLSQTLLTEPLIEMSENGLEERSKKNLRDEGQVGKARHPAKNFSKPGEGGAN